LENYISKTDRINEQQSLMGNYNNQTRLIF